MTLFLYNSSVINQHIFKAKCIGKRMIAKAWVDMPICYNATKVPILCYHSVNDSYCVHVDPIPIENFEKHLIILKKNFNVISLSNLVNYLIDQTPIPERAVVVTFDDGYVDNYTNAFPLLKRYGIQATFFLVTSFINHDINLIPEEGWGGMDWDQVKEMAQSDLINFGVHTHTHTILAKLSRESAKREITTSCSMMLDKLGFSPDLFAYPNGQADDIPSYADSILRELGFRAACSTFWRTVNTPKEIMKINRIMINGNDDVEILNLKLSGAYDYIYYIHKLKRLFAVR